MRSGDEPPVVPDCRATLERADTIVFLCSGNMVRSAFAELYGSFLGCPTPLRSGATIYRNDALFPETARALDARGVGHDAIRAFRPTHVDDLVPQLSGSPIFFGMREHHLDALRPWPEHHARGFLLGDVHRGGEILDPVLEGADFEATFSRVAECVERIVADLS